jgi:hypothetical protein
MKSKNEPNPKPAGHSRDFAIVIHHELIVYS